MSDAPLPYNFTANVPYRTGPLGATGLYTLYPTPASSVIYRVDLLTLTLDADPTDTSAYVDLIVGDEEDDYTVIATLGYNALFASPNLHQNWTNEQPFDLCTGLLVRLGGLFGGGSTCGAAVFGSIVDLAL